MRVGGDIRKLPGDDEISIVLNDRGDEKVNPNENIWPRSGVQANDMPVGNCEPLQPSI